MYTSDNIDDFITEFLRNTGSGKEAKRIDQLFKDLEKKYPVTLHASLLASVQSILDGAFTKAHLTRVSFLLEHSPSGRLVIDSNVPAVLACLRETITTLIAKKRDCITKDDQDVMYYSSKVCLQLFQYAPSSMKSLVSSDVTDTPKQQDFKIVMEAFIHVLTTNSFGQDCSLLIGTSIARVFTVLECREEFCQLLQKLGTDFTVQLHHISLQCQSSSHTSISNNWNFGHLALVNGVLCTGNMDILLGILSTKKSEISVMEHIFDVANELTRTQYQYHAFQVIKLWYDVFAKLLSEIKQRLDRRLLEPDLHITKATLQLIWTNWDSPIDGVAESTHLIFKSLVHLHIAENLLWDVKEQTFLHDLSKKLMETSWNVKGKFKPLSVLVAVLGAQKLLHDYPNVPCHLLECLSVNHLAPSACDLYKAFIQQTKSESADQAHSIWENYWMKPLLMGLTSENTLLRHNTSIYWLPCTFKTFPALHNTLVEEINKQLGTSTCDVVRCRLLHGWVAILKSARMQHFQTQLPEEPLRECLHHLDDGIRGAAIGLVCNTAKKAEPVSEIEYKFLEETLPQNMNIDCAAFRQQLIANVKNVIVRLRDSSLAKLRQTKNGEVAKEVLLAVDFIEFLVELCYSNLFPGSCYQRRATALSMLNVIYDNLTLRPGRGSKSLVPETISKMLDIAKHQGKWDFSSLHKAHILWVCLQDGTAEIRENAAQLLMTFFPWTVIDDYTSSVASHVISQALKLCNSPKAMEAESGALMCKMAFIKYVLAQHMSFTPIPGSVYGYALQPVSDNTASLQFISHLVAEVGKATSVAKRDVLKAASKFPSHGLLLAINKCLTDAECINAACYNEWRPLISELVRLCGQLVDIMLEVLAGKSENKDVAPSFAEMGEAIESLVGDASEDTNLSEDHQLILAWCWLNMKECSILYGQLVHCLPVSCDPAQGLLDQDCIQRIGDVFVKILTMCRHRGAIEGCSLGFIKFCQKLMGSSDPTFNSVPKQILDQVLSVLDTSTSFLTTSSSITRRSAGLPLLVQCVLASEAKMKQTHLLQGTMDVLLKVASQPEPQGLDQKYDLPQVHAIFILKDLFRDSSLATAIMPHISKAVMLCVRGFSSPVWAVRNSATHLYGVLVSRMLRPKRARDDQSIHNSTTAPEFFGQYPELCDFMLDQLQGAAQQCKDSLNPELFPILTLLAKLGPGVSGEHDGLLAPFQAPVLLLCGSPIYTVRELAASALVPLIHRNRVSQFITKTLGQIPAYLQDRIQYNDLHGKLLLIQKLIQAHPCSDYTRSRLIDLLMRRSWLCKPASNYCDLIKAKYLEIVQGLSGAGLSQCGELVRMCKAELYQYSQTTRVHIGSGLWYQQLVAFILDSSTKELSVLEHVALSLTSASPDVVLACLQWLKKTAEKELDSKHRPIFWKNVLENVTQHLLVESYPPSLQLCLELIVTIHRMYNSVHITELQKAMSRLRELEHAGCTVAAHVVPAMAVVFKQMINTQKRDITRPLLHHFCSYVLQCSHPSQYEDYRLQAAVALQVAGLQIIDFIVGEKSEEGVEEGVVRLFESAVQLLEDEQSDIRQQAAIFVSQIPRDWEDCIQYKSLSSNCAKQILCEYASNCLSWSETWTRYFCSKIYTTNDVISEIQSYQKTERSSNLFEQEDFNIYAEKTITTKMYHEMLKNNVTKGSHGQNLIGQKWWRDTMATVTIEMRQTKTMLQHVMREHPIFNVSSYSKVYSAINSLLLYADVLSTWAKLNCSDECVFGIISLEKLTQEIQQVFGSHPLLQHKFK